MGPGQLHFASAKEHTAISGGQYNHSSAWPAIGPAKLHGKQDTIKVSGTKQCGADLYYNANADSVMLWLSRMERNIQVTNMEDCATQLRRLEDRVDFLERYVFELLPPLSQERLDRDHKYQCTPEDLQEFLDLIQGTMPLTTPENK